MARTLSNMLPLGTEFLDFEMLNTSSWKTESVYKYIDNQPVLLFFICNHCPFVIHLHKGIQEIYADYKNTLHFLAISSNDVANYPEDSPEKMKELFEKLNLKFPYFYDETQEYAKKMDAACTPDFYLFDSAKKLVYRGRFDESRPGNEIEVTGKDLREAIDLLLLNKPINQIQHPSLGCNIKWK
jgi:thiol-disulfide isomerase/thioredoxin